MAASNPTAAPAAGVSDAIAMRSPAVEDASAMWRLVDGSDELELNSAYAYLILCRHFADTCVVAEVGAPGTAGDGEEGSRLAGFVAGYRPPTAPDALFVWQVGVAAPHRGLGLGSRMLLTLLSRLSGSGVRFLEATVTPLNGPSQRLFRSVARELDAPFREAPCFAPDLFPDADHEAEGLIRIGPL